MSTPALLKTKDAAQHIGVSEATLVRWAQLRADVRGCKFARGWWIVAQLDRVLGGAK